MKRTRMSVAVVALATAGTLALTACGGGDGKSDAGPKKNSVPKSSVNDISATDRGQLKQGGTLNWPLGEIAENFNYNEIDGTLADGLDVERALMPITMLSDAAGTVSPNPDYLTSATADDSSGKQVVTYEINPKAKWSDGTPMSWKDFEASWKAMNGKDKKYKISSSTGYELIASVAKGKTDQEAVVTFSSPFGDWKSLFSPLYPASVIGTPDGFNSGYLGKIPVTAGPFTFQGIDKTAKTITVVRNADWWGSKAVLDKIIYRALDSDATAGAFANGEVDFFNVGPDSAAYKQAKEVKGADIRKAAGPNYRHITFNGTHGALQDVKVRQAIMSALNRQAIAESDLQGLDWDPTPLNNHFFVTNQKGYKDNSAGVGTFDQAKAKSLLDAAGWKQSGAFRTKAGKTLELNFVIPANVSTSANEGKLMQPMLKAVGIKLNIKSVPLQEFFDKYVNTGNFDLTAFSWLGTAFPVSSTKSIYAKPVGDNIQQNYTGVGSAELDTAMNKAAADTDPAQAIADANAADVLIWQEANVLTLYQRPDIYAVKSNLVNIGAAGFQDLRYENIGFTK
ncbi:ABC transporter family substrate-binding protein [Streptomyces sp. NBC_01190]|uniref:ABC transporter family substrate-binding protein n=1 Tax=Streptomyces sp. NBC_01190 TaxID=2903767 RepID=UPI00386556FA|nr:ABC transporter family substrate-binding protein [Streptomyces sp. NBC_01190]